jgi:hypothetical protein
MVSMLTDRSQLVTDTWVKATWKEFLIASEYSELAKRISDSNDTRHSGVDRS